VHFGIASALMAVKQAQLDFTREDLCRVCELLLGTIGDFYRSVPEMEIIREKGSRAVDPCLTTKISAHSVASQIGFYIGIKGPNTTVNSACAQWFRCLRNSSTSFTCRNS